MEGLRPWMVASINRLRPGYKDVTMNSQNGKVRGPYNIHHITDDERKKLQEKLSNPKYLDTAITRIANKLSDYLAHRQEV